MDGWAVSLASPYVRVSRLNVGFFIFWPTKVEYLSFLMIDLVSNAVDKFSCLFPHVLIKSFLPFHWIFLHLLRYYFAINVESMKTRIRVDGSFLDINH